MMHGQLSRNVSRNTGKSVNSQGAIYRRRPTKENRSTYLTEKV